MSPITTKRHGDVLIIGSNNPPVNALGHAVREALVRGFEEAGVGVKAVSGAPSPARTGTRLAAKSRHRG